MSTLSDTAIDALELRIQVEIDSGRSGAAQYALALGDQVITGTFGDATAHHRFVIFSATKTFSAMALLPHLADGSLELTAQVARYIPEFAEQGKGEVTVLQLLTMQGGFPQAPMTRDRWGTSEGRRVQFAEWRLDWPAGTRTEYHPVSAHWVIGELLETLTGRPYVDVIHERVTAPADAPPLLGPAGDGPVVTVRATGAHPGNSPVAVAEMAEVYGRNDLVPQVTIGPEALLSMNHPLVQAAGIPGGGGRTRAEDAVRVYRSFLRDDSPWMRDAIGVVRNGSVNVSDGVPACRTIAGVVGGEDGYHRHRWYPSAPRSFGHAGAGGQLCWCDPATGLSFSFLHDTLHGDPRVDFLRSAELNELALACVRS